MKNIEMLAGYGRMKLHEEIRNELRDVSYYLTAYFDKKFPFPKEDLHTKEETFQRLVVNKLQNAVQLYKLLKKWCGRKKEYEDEINLIKTRLDVKNIKYHIE